MRLYRLAVILLSGLFIFNACSSSGHKVKIGDSEDRRHYSASLTIQDFRSLADKLTNKMLEDDLFVSAKEKPRMLIGFVRNFTDDESIRVEELYNQVEESLVSSKMVRVMSSGSTEFDLVGKFELTSARQYGDDDAEEVTYILRVKLYDLDGEAKGSWSADLMLLKEEKSWL